MIKALAAVKEWLTMVQIPCCVDGLGLFQEELVRMLEAVFLYCCPDCSANAIQIGHAAWAI